jgi:hypothetical protein
VPSSLAGVVTATVAGTTYHSLALKGDGTVVAWGCGSGSDFGLCSVPIGLSGVTAIAAGFDHSLALAQLKNQTINVQKPLRWQRDGEVVWQR